MKRVVGAGDRDLGWPQAGVSRRRGGSRARYDSDSAGNLQHGEHDGQGNFKISPDAPNRHSATGADMVSKPVQERGANTIRP